MMYAFLARTYAFLLNFPSARVLGPRVEMVPKLTVAASRRKRRLG
jgi:hypothetical protein